VEVAMSNSFWETFLIVLIFLPLAMVWGFALVDIFRRVDLSGGWKALWTVVIFLLPFLGTLIYLVSRPAGATSEERAAMDQADRDFAARYAPDDRSSQLKVLSDLHDRGKLTDTEFAAEKARIVDQPTAPTAAQTTGAP
jgi:hypothetical protein